jgi:hypothetical protein
VLLLRGLAVVAVAHGQVALDQQVLVVGQEYRTLHHHQR